MTVKQHELVCKVIAGNVGDDDRNLSPASLRLVGKGDSDWPLLKQRFQVLSVGPVDRQNRHWSHAAHRIQVRCPPGRCRDPLVNSISGVNEDCSNRAGSGQVEAAGSDAKPLGHDDLSAQIHV